MKLTAKKLLLYFALLMTVCLPGCRKGKLHDVTNPEVAGVVVSPDWSADPDANPTSVVAWFYSLDDPDLAPLRYEFSGRDGGEIELPVGKYNMIIYNNDTEMSMSDAHDEFHTHLLTTRTGSIQEMVPGAPADDVLPRPAGTENEPIMMSPEPLWGSSLTEVNVKKNKKGYLTILQPVMHRLTFRYTFEIRNVQGLKNVTHLCALITGMAPSLTLHDRMSAGEPCSIPLVAEIVDATTIKGEFHTFGRIGKTRGEEIHLFGLYMWLRNGEPYTYGMDGEELFDITDQLVGDDDEATTPGGNTGSGDGTGSTSAAADIHIEIEGLNLPPVPDIAGNVAGDINDWNKTETESTFAGES